MDRNTTSYADVLHILYRGCSNEMSGLDHWRSAFKILPIVSGFDLDKVRVRSTSVVLNCVGTSDFVTTNDRLEFSITAKLSVHVLDVLMGLWR